MSRRSSRLHRLESNLKAPRKSRARSRALTVMRLEGSASGAQPNRRAGRLPKDIEDQIAVVRGRAVSRPSRGLLQLEERLLGTHDVEPLPPAIQRYDHGAPPPGPVASQARALAASVAGSAFGGGCNVESFEETSAAVPGEPVESPRTEFYTGTRAATVEHPRTELYAGTAPAAIQGRPATATPSAGAVPWASEQSDRSEPERAMTQDQQNVAANCERDIAAMLGSNVPATTAPEDKQWDDTLRSVSNAPSATSRPATAGPEAPHAPKPEAHEVFHQIGLAMNYANSFDLGAVDLSRRFDQFDNEFELAPKTETPASAPFPVQALALDDFDLVADLTEISGAQSTATPAPAAPSSQPTTNPEPATTPVT